MELKLQYVKKQWGVFDPAAGGYIICKDREHVERAVVADPRFIPVSRHVSDWLEDHDGLHIPGPTECDTGTTVPGS